MAIDPSLSLQATPPQPFDWMKFANFGLSQAKTLQDIAASKTAQANTEANTANLNAANQGIQAQSAIQQRAADYNNWLTDNASKPEYINAGGSSNIAGLLNAARVAGYQNEASQTAQADLNQKATAISNANGAQNTSIARADFVTGLLGHTANELVDVGPAAAMSLLQQRAQYADSVIPGAGQQLLNSFTMADPKGTVGPDGQPLKTLDTAKISGVRQAMITPLQQQDLSIAQQNANTSATSVVQQGLAGMTSPGAQQPNSPESIAARKFAVGAGVLDPNDNSTSAYQLRNVPGLAQTVDAQVISSGAKAVATQNSAVHLQQSAMLTNASHAVDRLISRGLIDANTNIGSWIQANAGKYLNDPDVVAAKQAMAVTPGIDPTFTLNQGAGAVSAGLNRMSAGEIASSRVQSSAAKSNTYNQIAPTAEAAAANPPAPRPSATPAPIAPPAGAIQLLMQHRTDPNYIQFFKNKYNVDPAKYIGGK